MVQDTEVFDGNSTGRVVKIRKSLDLFETVVLDLEEQLKAEKDNSAKLKYELQAIQEKMDSAQKET